MKNVLEAIWLEWSCHPTRDWEEICLAPGRCTTFFTHAASTYRDKWCDTQSELIMGVDRMWTVNNQSTPHEHIKENDNRLSQDASHRQWKRPQPASLWHLREAASPRQHISSSTKTSRYENYRLLIPEIEFDRPMQYLKIPSLVPGSTSTCREDCAAQSLRYPYEVSAEVLGGLFHKTQNTK